MQPSFAREKKTAKLQRETQRAKNVCVPPPKTPCNIATPSIFTCSFVSRHIWANVPEPRGDAILPFADVRPSTSRRRRKHGTNVPARCNNSAGSLRPALPLLWSCHRTTRKPSRILAVLRRLRKLNVIVLSCLGAGQF